MISRILTIAGKGLDKLEQKLVDWTRQLEAVAPRNVDIDSVFVYDTDPPMVSRFREVRPPGIGAFVKFSSPADALRPNDRHGLVPVDDLRPNWAPNTDLKAIEAQAARCAPPKPAIAFANDGEGFYRPTPEQEARTPLCEALGCNQTVYETNGDRELCCPHAVEYQEGRNKGMRFKPKPPLGTTEHSGVQQVGSDLVETRVTRLTSLGEATPPSSWWATASVNEQIEKRLELRAMLGRKGYPDGHTKAEHRALLEHWYRGPRRPQDDDPPPRDSWRRAKRIRDERQRVAKNQRSLKELLDTVVPNTATGLEREKRRGDRLFLECEIRRSQMILRDLRGRSAARIRNLEARVEVAEAKAEVIGGEWCAKNRAEGRGPCGTCSICCGEERARAEKAEARVRELEKVHPQLDRCPSCNTPVSDFAWLDEANRAAAQAKPVEPLPGSKPAIEVGQRWVCVPPWGGESPLHSDSIIDAITDTEVFWHAPGGGTKNAATSRKTFVDAHSRLRRPEELNRPAPAVGQRWVYRGKEPHGEEIAGYDSVITRIEGGHVHYTTPLEGSNPEASTPIADFVRMHVRLRRPEEIT